MLRAGMKSSSKSPIDSAPVEPSKSPGRAFSAIETELRGRLLGLRAAFEEAVRAMAEAPGRVIVTGMGKSGHIARKIAATLASTSRPAAFVHPAEASHGDLGMVQNGDVVLGISLVRARRRSSPRSSPTPAATAFP